MKIKNHFIVMIGLIGSINVSAEEKGWWRLELKTLECHQETFSDSSLVWALAASGNPCTPIGDSSGSESFVMIECPRTGTNYILAPTKDSCIKAAKKIKPLHNTIKNSEGKIPFNKLEEKTKLEAVKKNQDQVKIQADKENKEKLEQKNLNSIEGAWKQDCYYYEEAESYITSLRTFANDVYTNKTNFYGAKDKSCNKLLSSIKATGSYKSGSIIDASNNTKELDIVVSQVMGIARSEDVANEFTAQSYGGIMVWVAGKEYDMTKVYATKPVFTVYKIESGKLIISQDPEKIDVKNRKMLKFDKNPSLLTRTNLGGEE